MNVTSILHLHEIGGKKNQEDYLWPEAGAATVKDRVFIVCDGVGGSENGEVAARVISSEVGKALESADAKPMSEEYLAELIGKAKESLMFHATRDVLGYEMATTFSMLYLEDSRAFMGWCGDSRVYHVRNGKVLYKTEDHSLVNSLVKSGEITEEEALIHPRRNIILKAIKADYEPVEVEGHWIEDIRDGDYFMLCTDGLLENIGNKELEYLLKDENAGKIDIVSLLQEWCLDKTRDNFSMYLIRVSMKPVLVASPRKWFSFIVLLLVIAAAIVAAFYFVTDKAGKNEKNQVTAPVPVTDSAAEAKVQDSLSDFEIVAVPASDTLVRKDSSKIKSSN